MQMKDKNKLWFIFGSNTQVSLSWKRLLLLSSVLVYAVFTPITRIIAEGNKKHTDIFEEQFSEINDINFLEGGKSLSQYNLDYGRSYLIEQKSLLIKKTVEILFILR